MVIIDHLIKRYGDYCLDLSMEIPEGCITGLIGKNGAGKSTTIKSILGLVRPEQGRVTILGKDATKLSQADKERIGVALSDSGFSQYLCAEDVVKILRKMYHSFDEQKFRRIAQEQGLPMEKKIKDFSTGMKAKLRVLVAMSHAADLLILDEPTAGLDVEARIQILDMIRSYLAEKESRSVLITSHISSDLEGLCDDLYLIHNGKVILHEETDIILERYGILKVDEATYEKLDQSHILKKKKESFGYVCLTDQKQFYRENYPGIVIENGNVDELILMMTGV